MKICFEVNGRDVEVAVEPRLTLADCLRHHLRLTGTHVGCEHGVCGACTVLVDGKAAQLPYAGGAGRAAKSSLSRAVEDEGLTPLQASFRKHHALQCGFCTPGMITTAHALLSAEPDCDADRVREVLSEILPLHRLCVDRRGRTRCARRLQGRRVMKTRSPARRWSGADRRFLRGRGEYVDDLVVEGLLHAVILRSAVAHGRIVSLDTSTALKCPGVHAVITGKDMPGGVPIIPMRLQPLPEFKPYEQPVLAYDKVRYVGEPIAVVLADSVAMAEDALEAIGLDIEPLPAVAGHATAAKNSSLLFETTGTNRSLVFHARKRRRRRGLSGTHPIRHGSALDRATLWAHDGAARLSWHTGMPKGRLTISGAAKVPFFNRRILAKQMGSRKPQST
jgi:aerobic-type carbon monoxide dehydrogenase small subunit (CoxS/CutS family)